MSGSVLSDVIEATGLPAIPKAVGDLLMKLAAPAADELGLLLADGVAAYRLRNQVRMLQKTLHICERAGIDPESVPMRTLVPLLDGAAWEDDDSLQDMWAALLASAAKSPKAVPPSFVSIMRELSPSDAELLQSLFVKDDEVDRDAPHWPPAFGYRNTPWRGKEVSLDNLVRLGLVSYDGGGERVTADALRGALKVLSRGHHSLDPDEHVERVPEWVTLTSMGEAFLKAMTGPASADQDRLG